MDKYLIDGHKLYWHLDRLKDWQEDKIIPPIYVEVSPVSYCNHKCIFCGIDFAMQHNMKLDTQVFCKKLKEMGQLGVKSIMYAGEGEPLLHKGLTEIIKETKNNHIDAGMTTNGTIGNYDLWKEILPYLTWIKFSVDAGTSEVYSQVHGVSKKVFHKTLESIKDAVKVKNDYKLQVTIGVQYLIIEENMNDIENAIKLFSQFGINYFVLKSYSLHPQMLCQRDVTYTEEKINFLQDIVDKYKTSLNIIFRKNALKKYMQTEKTFNHCYALPFWGYISSKGDFYTCSVFIGHEKFRAGNIYSASMSDIFFGNKRIESIKFGKKELPIEDECRINCRMARINEFLEWLGNKPDHINFI